MNIAIGTLLAIVVFSPAYCIGMVYNIYRRYYKYMKAAHSDEWRKLMNKDSVIELVGEWERWPFGSIYLIASFFRTEETYNDKVVNRYKASGMLYVKLFFISLILAILAIVILPLI